MRKKGVCMNRLIEDINNWTVVYNGSDTRLIVTESLFQLGSTYVFRVRARNMLGWSDISDDSAPYVLHLVGQ
jgi:hypothetical protein